MATQAINPYTSTKSLLSFLVEDDHDAQVYALKNISENIDYLWHELIDHIEHLINLQADPQFPETSLINYVLSKIFFHKEDYENALNYILEAKDHFDISHRNEFVDKMLAKAVDRYSKIQKHNYSDKEGDKIVMDSNLETIVNKSFQISIENKIDQNIVAGLGIEARRLDIVQQVVDRSDSLSNLLNHLFSISQNHVQSKLFKDDLIKLILKAYATTANTVGQDAWNVCHCYLHLGMPVETAKVITDLLNKGDEESILLALQISSDIQEAENQYFIENLKAEIEKHALENQNASAGKIKVLKILTGEFNNTNTYKFLSQNNRSNKDIVSTMKKYHEKNNSTTHNAIINSYAIMHAGTLDDTFLEDEDNKEWAAKSNNWAKFLSIGCMGTIHRRNPEVRAKLNEFLPGGAGAGKGQWINGGALFALGLAKSGTKNQNDIDYFGDQLNSNQEGVIHGACLGMGLVGMSTFDLDLVERLKVFLYNDDATMGESAAYAIGLIMAGRMNGDLMQELFQTARENEHEKIIRGISISLAMMCYEHEEEADTFLEQMISEKDALIRYGGAYAIGMAYVGTGNNKALKKLLKIAASDVVQDVRRAAVTSIGFVMLNDYRKVPKIITLLSDSYNAHVRYGAAMAIGISCANTNYSEAIKLLKELEDDDTDYVRQGVTLSMALVLQQATDKHDKNVEPFREKLMTIVKKKKKGKNPHKFGAILALGILESGGRNSVVKLRSESGTMKRGSIMGMMLFTQMWYWFPMIQMISLCLEPTFLMGVNKDLKIPKGFEFKSNVKKSIFDYPPILTETKKKTEGEMKVVLSTTRRAKAKKALKKGEMEEEGKKEEEGKMEEEGNKEEGKMEEEEAPKEPEEPATCILKNPSRVLRIQEKTIDYIPENRYRAVLQNRKRGYVFLVDSQPDQAENFVDEQPLQAWLIPPPDFYFDENIQDE